MKIDERHLVQLAAVAETGGVTEGAAMLGMTQPAVSRTLSMLERRVGEPLFTPGKRPLQLTPLGQQLAMTPQMQQALRLLQVPAVELKQEIQEALDSNPMLERQEEGEDFDNTDPLADNVELPDRLGVRLGKQFELDRFATGADLLGAEEERFDTWKLS